MDEFGILGKVEVAGNLSFDEMDSPAYSLEAIFQKSCIQRSPLRDLESVK